MLLHSIDLKYSWDTEFLKKLIKGTGCCFLIFPEKIILLFPVWLYIGLFKLISLFIKICLSFSTILFSNVSNFFK